MLFRSEYSVGHRYWCVWVLAVTAMKCGVSLDELERDAFGLIERFNKDENPFTKEDVLAALEGYDSAWFTYPVEKMAYRSNIPIEKNKRNGRTQEEHMKVMRAIQGVVNPNWRDGNGRPKGSGTKEEIVLKWRAEHPEGKKVDCIRDTGLTKPTVYKWWNN